MNTSNLTPTHSVVVSVDVLNGPAGGYGFRRGNWTATRADGSTFQFFASISHGLELDEQRAHLLAAAIRADSRAR